MQTDSETLGMNMYGPINPEDFLVAFLNVSSRLDGSKDIERVFME